MFGKNKKMKEEIIENSEAIIQEEEQKADAAGQNEEIVCEADTATRERDFSAELEKAYCLGAGIDDDTLKQAKQKLFDIAEAVSSGAFRPEMLQLAIRIINFDRSIEDARKEGEEKGRKESAAESARSRQAAAREAASIPHLRGTKGLGNAAIGDSIFDIARKA